MLDTALTVKRTLSDGHQITVGQLAENPQGTYFQYDEAYLAAHPTSLAPFNLKADRSVQRAQRQPHYGLHGVFGDSLPDGWGLYLMDRVFRQHGYNPQQVTALERLACIGERGFGALSYEPELPLAQEKIRDVDIITLGREAIQEFEGTESALIEQLMQAGGSGGARPKMSVTRTATGAFSTAPDAIGEHVLVKLTSDKFDLKHSESLIEYLYLTLARQAGIEVPDFELLDAGEGRYWLMQKRFDCTSTGRKHMISACGLLDASFREPSLDYIELTKATRLLCGVADARQLVRRALFNYLTVNQDDHSKNFAFLADDQDQWHLSPCYDIVYSPSPYQQHMTAFEGNGQSPANALIQLAGQAGFANTKPLKEMIDEIYETTRSFKTEALNLGVPKSITNLIDKHMTEKWQALQ